MENIINTKNFYNYVVIGLGIFGKSLALSLAEKGKSVLAIDTDTQNVEDISSSVTHAVVADITQKDVLYSLGVQNFDCAIVCIGNDISSSILATSICKELGVKYVISKAQDEQHKTLLKKVGADLVVFPEVLMGKKLSIALTDPYSNEIMKVSEKYKIVEIKCPTKWVGKSLEELAVRKKYSVTIIFIKREEEIIEPLAEVVFEKGDGLIIAGSIKNINLVENKSDDVVDITNTISDALSEE